MGMNISIGEDGSKDYVSIKLATNLEMVGWHKLIKEKTHKKFKYIYGDTDIENGNGIYKVENLGELLKELDEIYKLKIKGYYDIVKTFRRMCRIAIRKQLPIIASY